MVLRFAGRLSPLALILVFGGLLRLAGLDWGDGHPIHPDERHVINMVSGLSWSDPNPHNFAYGSLPLYLLRAVGRAAALVAGPQMESYDNLFLLGRLLSTLAAILTIALVYQVGRREFDGLTALLASAFLSVCVLHIQLSHFYTVEQLLVFFVTAAFWASLRIAREGTGFDYLLGGMLTGMAVATKLSALPLGAVLVTAHLLHLARSGRWFDRSWLWLVVCFGAAYMSFYVCQPFAFRAFPLPSWEVMQASGASVFSREFWQALGPATFSAEFLRDFWEQSNMVRGVSQPIYVAVYENTTAYVYQARELIAWGMGPPLGLVCLAGTGYLLLRCCRSGWAWLRREETGGGAAALVPAILILAWLLPNIIIVGGFKVKFLRYLAPLLPFFCLAGAKLLADLWTSRDPVLARAGRWMVTVTLGYGLFYSLAYTNIFFRPHPHLQASAWFAENAKPGLRVLQEHWDETLPHRLPGTPTFTGTDLPSYDPDSSSKVRSFSRLLAESDFLFCSSDRIYGTILSWQSRWPQTSRFYKLLFSGELGWELSAKFSSPPRFLGITLDDWNADESFLNYDHPTVLVFENKQRLDADRIAALIEAPSDRLDSLTLGQSLELLPRAPGLQEPSAASLWQALRWWLLLSLLGWLVFPLCFRVFESMPDRGLGASKTLGLLGLSYVAWLGAMLGWTEFTRAWLVAILLFEACLAALAWQRWGTEIWGFLRERWRLVLGWELGFLGVGAAFLLVRAYNPEIYWGEKPMDFSFLNAFLRTEQFPPQEPWFSGAPLNYYYFGFVMVSAAGKLGGIAPGVLYNLACATIPAQVFVLALGLGLSLVRRPWLCVLMGVFTVLLGNLAWPFEVLAPAPRQGFDLFWATSRVIDGAAIEEYPLWTFLFADLHAHMMAMPACLLTLFTALNLLGAGRRKPGFGLGAALCCAMALGSLFVTNAWDFISYTIILGGLTAGLELAGRKPGGYAAALGLLPAALIKGAVVAGALAALGLGLFYPYFGVFHAGSTYHGPNRDGFVPLRDVGVLFGQFLWIHWICLIGTHYHGRAGREGGRHQVLLTGSLLWAAGALAVVLLDLDAKPYVTAGFALGLSVLAAATAVLGETRKTFVAAWLMLCLGAALLGLADLYTVADRMNTIFKAYNTVWYLFALSAGACVYRSLLAVWDIVSEPQATRFGRPFLAVSIAAAAATVIVLAIGAGSIVVNVRGVTAPQRVPVVRPTIDGSAYLRGKFPEDARGIEWLNKNVKGMATVLEAWGPSYQDFTRICMHTGLSTVLGWDYHVQQRGQKESEIRARQRDIAAMYTSENPLDVRSLLEGYEVDYVFVGELETRVHGSQALDRFESVPDLTLVFATPRTRIYQASRSGGSGMPVAAAAAMAPERGGSGAKTFLPPSSPGAENVGSIAVGPQDELYLLSWRSGTVEQYGRGGKHIRSLGQVLEAANARLQSIWAGRDGRLLGADPWNDRVVEISKDGTDLTVHGLEERLRRPQAAIADAEGRIWVADTGNDRVVRLGKPARSVVETPDGPLREPSSLALTPTGDILVLSVKSGGVYRIRPEGDVEKLFSLPESQRSILDGQATLAVEPDGQVLVSDTSGGLVFRYEAGSELESVAGVPGTPSGIGVDRAGNVFIGDALRGGVYLLSKPASVNAFAGGQGPEAGQMDQPRGVAWAPDGSFWVADFDNHRVQKFRRDGKPLLAVGQEGDQEGEFRQPCDLAVLPNGGVAVADTWNHRVQILDARGKFVRAFGEFFGPRGVALGPDQLLYVTDTGNGMVKVFDLEGKAVRSWGGKGAGPGMLDGPVGIAVDSERVFVADVGNGRVEVFSLLGEFRSEIPVPAWRQSGGEPHLALDGAGRLLATMPAENRVVLLDLVQGEIDSMRGAGRGAQPLQGPTGIDVRGSEVLVADTHRHKVQKFEKAFP